MEHTPAPWEVGSTTTLFNGTSYEVQASEIMSGDDTVALCTNYSAADAALIAAAPELLAALLNLLQIAEGVRENTTNTSARQFQQMHIDAARAVLRKAGGAA